MGATWNYREEKGTDIPNANEAASIGLLIPLSDPEVDSSVPVFQIKRGIKSRNH